MTVHQNEKNMMPPPLLHRAAITSILMNVRIPSLRSEKKCCNDKSAYTKVTIYNTSGIEHIRWSMHKHKKVKLSK